MTESQLREAFSDLAARVVPKPDAYARLMQRRIRRRWWLVGTVSAMVAGVTLPLALNAASPAPSASR